MTFQGNGVPIEPAVLREALRFHEDPPELQVRLDPDVLYADIKDAFSTREQPYRDASFKVNGGTVRIESSRIGRSLDMEAIAQEILDAPGTAVRARFRVTKPETTTAELKGLRRHGGDLRVLHAVQLLRAAGHQHPARRPDPGRHDHPGRQHLLAQRRAGAADRGPRLRRGAPDRGRPA